MDIKRNIVMVLTSIGLIFLITAGCSSSDRAPNEARYDSDSGYAESADMAMEKSIEMTSNSVGISDSGVREEITNDLPSRMVVYNANLSLEVKEYQKVESDIQNRVSSLNGYVVESSIYYSGEDRINGNLVVKVPQQSFYSFINELESNSVKVHERHVSGNDVTEEYVDLEARLKSKRVVEERLLSFMKDAELTEDLLKISSDLANVQQEIEQLVGRMKYLETNVDFSTVSIYLSETLVKVPEIQAAETLNTWLKAKSLFMDSVNGLIAFFSQLIVLLIGLSPIIAPVTVVIIVAFLFIKKKKQKPKPPIEG